MKGIQHKINYIYKFIEIPLSYILCYLMKNMFMSKWDKLKYLKYNGY